MVEGDGAVGTNGAASGTGGTVDWRVSFPGMPDDLKSEQILGRYKDPISAFKGVVEKERALGGAFQLPKADAPETEWDEKVFGRLAAKSPDDYQFAPPPDGVTADPEMDKWFKTAAFEAKVPPLLANRIRAKYNERVSALTAQYKAEEEKGRAALKTEWGADYEQKVELANRAAPDAVKQKLHQVGLNADPDILRWLAGVSASRKEDGGLGAGASGGSGRSRAIIQQEIDTLMQTPEYNGTPGTNHKAHEAAILKYQQLCKERGSTSV